MFDNGYEIKISLDLAVIFLMFKIFGVVEWSWFWVLSPIWIQIVFYAVATIIQLIVYKRMVGKNRRRRRR